MINASDNAPPIVANEDEAAKLLRVSKSWMAHKRVNGGGPAFIKLGPRRIVYPMDSLRDFIARQTPRQTTSEYPRPATEAAI